MRRPDSVWLQIGLVVLLFLGSLAALLFNAFAGLRLPGQELEARERLREAGRELTQATTSVADGLPSTGRLSEETGRRLQEIAERVLADHSNIEGGFYLVEADRFVVYAFPTGPPGLTGRTDPPPYEAEPIRTLARQALSLPPGEDLVSVQDVGPSRVAVLTAPVGTERPARLVAWVMHRLTGPEQLAERTRRLTASTGLALGGIALSLVLTWNLARGLRQQRREQQRLRDELRHAEHLAVLGKMLAAVAHEVRNPLAAIRSTVQLWQRLPDEARTPESLGAVVASVDRLNDIVGRLLLFSRADRAERRPVDINAVLGEGLDLIAARAAEQGVVIERDLAPGLPSVSGSLNALRQVVLNLLTNALQAMPGGGRLHCRTRYRAGEGRVELRVADTGSGVPEEVRRRLFEPFVTTRPEGTGLGLALCREIVTGHGGTIRLEDGPGSGAVFVVLLPASPEPVPTEGLT